MRCVRCGGRMLSDPDGLSCINCGFTGPVTSPSLSSEAPRRAPKSHSDLTAAVLALLDSGHPYTIAQIASTLRVSRKRIDAIAPSLINSNLATIAGLSGRARLLRKP